MPASVVVQCQGYPFQSSLPHLPLTHDHQHQLLNFSQPVRRLIRRQRHNKPASVATTIEDTPLYCLYRLYEHLVLNHRFGLRDEIEHFWNHSSCFPIPRTRMRALCCSVMYPPHARQASNRNIGYGLPRDAPAIMSNEEMAELSTRERTFLDFKSIRGWMQIGIR